MRLNAKIIIADFLSIALQVLLIPVYILVFVVRVVLHYLDNSNETISKNIVVTGATSGLGEAIAKRYAKTAANLILFGRNKDKLERVKSECKAINSKCNVKYYVSDIADCDKFRETVEECARNEKVDLVVAAAGIIESTASNGSNMGDYMTECIDVNVKGVMNTIIPFIPQMKKNGCGKLCVIVGALGNGTFGMDPVYEGSKNCIRVMLEGMMPSLAADGIQVTIVSPGYMRTKMTEGKKTFMMLEPSYVADRIYEGVARKEQFICDPYPLYFLTCIVRAIPAPVFASVRQWLSKRKTTKTD